MRRLIAPFEEMVEQVTELTADGVTLLMAQVRDLLHQMLQVQGMPLLRLERAGLGLGPCIKVAAV
jgi:hypothetical protein